MTLFTFPFTEAKPREIFMGLMEKRDEVAPIAVLNSYDFVLRLFPKVERVPQAYQETVRERFSGRVP